jgi:EAL domain-containing protein (putative c-di-GMP-specific phosphodiesterase class I)/ActR/RegA family two-component response regulator
MTAEQPTLIVVDDDTEIAALIGQLGERAGFRPVIATDADAFFRAVEHDRSGAIVLDLQMPKLDGMEALRYLADQRSKASILIITGADSRTAASAEHYGTSRNLRMLGAVQKPFMPEDLLGTLRETRSRVQPLTVSDLREAIIANQLTIHYQPTIALTGGDADSIDSIEALIRWNHPERNILTAGSFLNLSDAGGLTEAITDFVLERGIEQLRAWHDGGLALTLRVNVNARLISDREFPDRLGALLREHDMEPRFLTLEINETAALASNPDTLDILTRLRLKAFNLSLDDFGAGCAHLRHLHSIPFSELKIDQSIIALFRPQSPAQRLIEGVIDLGHKLGMTVCAEGVESEETLSFLRGSGCDTAQGHCISRAVPAGEVRRAIAGWRSRRAGPH